MSYAALFFGSGGRFSRAQYCIGLAMCLFLYFAATTQYAFLAVDAPSHGFSALAWLGAPLAWIIWAYIVFLVVTIHIRRCHDLDLPGAYGLIALATIVGIAVALVIGGLKRGTIGPNSYGPDPLLDLVTIVGRFDGR